MSTSLAKLTNGGAVMLIVGLSIPKLKKFIRSRIWYNPRKLYAKLELITELIKEFYSLPENAVFNKAFTKSMYGGNAEILAKKLLRHV